jgi:hypothetical protein
MYLRTSAEALEAAAEILAHPDRRDRLIESTLRIMLCLEVEPRRFLSDVQAFLVEDGLRALRRRRGAGLDPFTESLAEALDALRFAVLVRAAFPDLRHERWRIARAVLVNEAGVRDALESWLRDRRSDPRPQEELEEMVLALHQDWMDRAGALRTACLEVLREADPPEPDRLHSEAELLFELVAVSDERAVELLGALDRDRGDAASRIDRIRRAVESVRGLPPTTPSPGAREVA